MNQNKSQNTGEHSELEELRRRVAALEAALASLQSSGSHGNLPSTSESLASSLAHPSRRTWLGLLAAGGAGLMLGSPARADSPDEFNSLLGPWKTYTPKLMAEHSDPVLTDGRREVGWQKSGQNGHYWHVGRTVLVKTWIQFGGGAKPGSGTYRLSLPVKAALGSDAWLGPTGVAIMHNARTKVNRYATVAMAKEDAVTFLIDNTAGGVTHEHPWVWGDWDGLNTFLVYEAAADA